MFDTEMMMIPLTLIQLTMTSIIPVRSLEEELNRLVHGECFCYVFTASDMLRIGYIPH